MNRNSASPVTVFQGSTLVAVLCLPYIVSQFLRSSVGVIGPNLIAEIGLGPAQLGLLVSIFFLSFSFAQIPLGAAIDRYGPKACLLSSVAIAVLGCILFSRAQSAESLMLARLIMGLGCATFFMAPLAIYTRWFSPALFSSLTGITLGIGTLGTLIATAPMAAAVAWIGWRAVFVYVALAALIFAVAIFFFVRDNPPGKTAPAGRPETFLHSLKGFATVVAVTGVWRLFLTQAVTSGIFASLLGLWAGPYLADIHGLQLEARGQVMFVMAATQVGGLFVWGPSDRLFASRKTPALIGTGAIVLLLLALAMLRDPPIAIITVLFGAFGFFAACMPVIVAHGRGLFPANLVGRGMTLLNIGTMGGAFALQTGSGFVITRLTHSDPANGLDAGAYQAIFGGFALLMIAAMAIYFKSPPSSART